MIRIGAAIAIAKEAAVDEPVVVGSILVLDGGAVLMVVATRAGMAGLRSRRSDQGDSDALELESRVRG